MNMSVNRMYLVWSLGNARKTYFYTKDDVTLMTTDFSKATILDSHDKIWEMAEDTKHGAFKVHQAAANEIFKWQLMNELPRERQ